VAIISITILFLSVSVNTIGQSEDIRIGFQKMIVEGETEIRYDWDEVPFFNSVDMEFINDGKKFLVAEWPDTDDGIPVISTWEMNGLDITELGKVGLPGEHSVLYNSGSTQCAIKIAVRESYNQTEIFVARCMSMYDHIVERYVLNERGLVEPETREVLLEINNNASWSYQHGIGEIEFGEDGNLWIFNGYNNWAPLAQDNQSLSGSVIRIEVSSDGEVTPAVGNPGILEDSDWNELLYAKGLRMPWTAVEVDGLWYIGDVGTALVEEINLLNSSGMNFGYGIAENEAETPTQCEDCEYDYFTGPLISYPHSFEIDFSQSDISARFGGYAVFMGTQIPNSSHYKEDLQNQIIFGDRSMGWMRSFNSSDTTESTYLGHTTGFVDMENINGITYMLTTGIQTGDDREPGVWVLYDLEIGQIYDEENNNFPYTFISILLLIIGIGLPIYLWAVNTEKS